MKYHNEPTFFFEDGMTSVNSAFVKLYWRKNIKLS